MIARSFDGARGGPAARSEFEVALVKPVDVSKLGNAISMNIGTVRREEVTFGNATLNDCIRFAYGMASDAQIAGPDWVKSKLFLYDPLSLGADPARRASIASRNDADDAGGAIQTDDAS